MNATKNIVMKQLPEFSAARCKRCGICSHFCAVHAIGVHHGGMPYLADPEACTSCGLCRDMCPDWAVSLEPTAVEAKPGATTELATGDTEMADEEAAASEEAPAVKPQAVQTQAAESRPTGNGSRANR